MIKVENKGDLKKLDRFFNKSLKIRKRHNLDEIAKRCVERLKEVTPKDTGITADSWGYEIVKTKGHQSINIYNTNIENGVKIVILLEHGHLSRNGTWVEGKHFINPVIRETYEEILNKTWKEMKGL